MVTKNPCSHPGDIRLLKAVNKEDPRYDALSHYVNVIVFPTTGARPEQHKMSGGDIDGDVYMALWDELILEHLTPDVIRKPATYKKFMDNGGLTSNRIEDHIKRYFEKDNLGRLSNLHLALCDQIGGKWDFENPPEGHGVLSNNLNEDLYKLSWLISVAVDFAKHGKCVEEKEFRHIDEKCKQWPDYMERPSSKKTVVQSEHILGKLYRAIDCKFLYKLCIEGDH